MVKEYHEPWSPTSNVASSLGSSSGRSAGGTPKPPPPLPPSVQKAVEKGQVGPEELRQVFKAIDKDKSGEISHQEMRYALWSLTGTKPTKAVVQVIMADIDTDENGVVDEDEFIEFFSTVNNLKTLREDIIHGEEKAGTMLCFVNVYGLLCIIGTLMFFLAEMQSDDPDFGGNWGLFVFGIMSLIWLVARVLVPLLMARISYWVPILRDIQSWLKEHSRKACRIFKNCCIVLKHKITKQEGQPQIEPGTPMSPMSPTAIALRAIASFKKGAPAVKTPYHAENYAEAAQHQSREMPLTTFKLAGNACEKKAPAERSFAADQPVYFLPYSQWDGGDLKAKVTPQDAWPQSPNALPALRDGRQPLPALEAPKADSPPTHKTSRFKALVHGEPVAPHLGPESECEAGSAQAMVEQALEERQNKREAEAAAPSLAERRGKPSHLAVNVPPRGENMPKLPNQNPPLRNPGV